MNSENFDEHEDIFMDNNDSELRLLSNEDFVTLVYEIVRNECLKDGATLCFQVFYRVMANSIQNKTSNDHSQLNIISKCVKCLKTVDKFDTFAFTELLLNEFIIIPLEVVWWLHKNEILYFSQYCDMLQPADLASDLLKIIKTNKPSSTFPTLEIISDLLAELIRGCYRPNPGICRLYRSKTWSEYCFQVLNDLIEETLRIVFKGNNEPFGNFFPFVENSRKYIPSIILRRFYENILNKILMYKMGEFDLHVCYMYQQLWCSEKIDDNILILYEEIFAKYCNMQNILDFMDEHQENINYKLTLMAVGVCVKKSSTGNVDVKNAAIKFLNDSFKGGKIKAFIKAILFIRQACMEKNMKINYRSWYSSTFGLNGDFKTTNNPTLFKFFINSLMRLIPYEPKPYLKIHIDQGISAPPKCNFLIHDYKDLCRTRLEELRQSPSVSIHGVETVVLHMVEESFRNECISPVMINIILTQREDFYNIIVPQILRKKIPFTKVKELLLQEKYLTNEIIHFSRADTDGKFFDDEDDDLIINKK